MEILSAGEAVVLRLCSTAESARELKTPITLFHLLTLQPPVSMALEANGRQREREAIS